MNKICLLALFALGVASGVWLPLRHSRIKNERRFAEYLLIREAGIYTLVGTKPITDILIEHETADAKSNNFQSTYNKMDEAIKLDFSISNYFDCNISTLWKRWKKRQSTTGRNCFLIQQQEPRCLAVYLVNKSLVEKTLSNHYDLFVKVLGAEFDVAEVLATIEDPDSFFWKELLRQPQAYGVLFGYGVNNATLFETVTLDTAQSTLSNPIADMVNVRFKKEVTLADLALPTFRSFNHPDPQIEHYQKERQQIQQAHHGADLRMLLIEALKP